MGPQYRDPKIIKFEKRRKKPAAAQPRQTRIPVFTPRGRIVAAVVGVALLIGAAVFFYELQRNATRFGSWDLAWRHASASSNCDAARRVHLENALRGEPGYYPQHDADSDGVACEPVPRRR